MVRRAATPPTDAPPAPALVAPNELWAYDELTDLAFTADRSVRDRLMNETKALVSGRYTLPAGDGFRPAWQLTVKKADRERAKQILGVTKLTS